MAKQLNVNLAFTADTREAKAQLQSLQQDLTKLTQTVGSKSPLGITKDISSAIGEVNKLQAALTKATTSSGKLDLGQFKRELNAANLSAEKIAFSLNGLGLEGQAAFAKLAQSVTLAEVPIRKVNTLLTEFTTTLKNTARWQLSSSILHGFVGALQGAYRYAQDLNKSLNSIRVVTGQSADQMAKFAKQANESAKALSATTTAYTDASLIFFQQGLTGDAVTERTDAVIKMSNVTGDSVEDVASYMTAIWNNFDDGSESLEHYADVITALGAATASSSAEISAGLEKFASIAGTVGLSYEYATSALATVVATTRQSADTVGTAFKTLFARLQGLKLGETLEDGVDLNKYAQALNAVGVQVLDATGNMRALDNILDDLAKKWDLLSSAQQTALAQTVAGTRQYNQLVALMSNWDFMEENLKTARNAEGSLQRQADIYAESWEAASKRVKASWQSIYDDLLDDKFFIQITNNISKILDEVHNFIDVLGGIRGILPGLSTAFLALFGKDLAKSIDNVTYNLQTFSKQGQDALANFRNDFNNQKIGNINGGDLGASAMTEAYTRQAEVQNTLLEKNKELAASHKELTEFEKLEAELLLDQVNSYGEIYIKSSQNLQQTLNETAALKEQTDQFVKNYQPIGDDSELQQNYDIIIKLQQAYAQTNKVIEDFRNKSVQAGDSAAVDGIEKLKQSLKDLGIESKEVISSIDKLAKAPSPELLDEAFVKIINHLEKIGGKSQIAFDDMIAELKAAGNETTSFQKVLEKLFNSLTKTGEQSAQAANDLSNLRAATNATNSTVKSFSGTTETLGSALVSTAQSFSSLAMGIKSISSLGNIWGNDNLSMGEKLIQTVSSLSFGILGLKSSYDQIAKTKAFLIAITQKEIDKENEALLADIAHQAVSIDSQVVTKASTAEVLKKVAAKEIDISTTNLETLAEELSNDETLKSLGLYPIVIQEILEEAKVHGYNTKAITAETIAQKLLNQEKLKEFGTSLLNKIKNLPGLIGKFITSLGPFGIAIGATVAAVTVAIAAYNRYKKSITEAAEAARNQADSHNEITNKYQEESENIDNLIEEYRKLKNEALEQGKSQQELSREVYDLAQQYNNQKIAVLGLADAYGNLDNALKEQQLENYNQLINSSREDINNYTKAASAGLKDSILNSEEYEHRMDNFGATIDLKGIESYVTLSEREKELITELSQLGIKFDPRSIDQMTTSSFINVATRNYEELENLLSNYSDVTFSKQLNSYLQANSDTFDKLQESIEINKNATLNSVFAQSFDENQISSIEDYYNLLNEIKENEKVQLLEIDEDELKEWFNAQIRSIDNVKKYAETANVIDYLISENDIEQIPDELANAIAEFEDSDRAQIILYPHIAWDAFNNGSLEDFINSGGQYSEAKYNAISTESILAKYAEKGKFEDSDLALASELLGINVANLKDDELLSSLIQFYEEQLKIANDYQKTAYEQSQEYYQKYIDEYENNFNKYEAELNESKNKISEVIESLFNENDNITVEGLIQNPEAYKKEIAAIKEFIPEIEDCINNIQILEERNNRVKKSYEEASNALQSLIELTENYDIVLLDLKKTIEGINKSIDGLQAAYKTVAAAQKEYTDNGYYSVDTIQSLLDLGPEYLRYLTISGEEIEVDTNAIKDQQTAYYDLLEAKYADYYQTQMAIIQQAEETKEIDNTTVALYTQAITQNTLNGSLLEFVANCAAAADGATIYDEALRNLAATAQKTYDIINLGRTSLSEDLEGVMNATPKGSSGSKGSTDRKDTKNYIKEFDRLYAIKKALEDIADAISDLNKEESHLTGRSLAEALEKENELLTQQKDLYLELLNQQSDYRDELAGALEQYGATFDYTTGNLTNYLEITQGALDKYNAAVEAYNSSHDKGAFSVAEQEYEYFKEVLSAYQTILTDMQETQNNLDDNFLKQIENNLKGFEADIKVNLDFEEARRKVNNFFKEIGNNFKKVYKSTQDWVNLFNVAADNVTTYTEASGTIATDLKAIQEVAEYLNNEGYNNPDENSLFVSRDDAINKYKELTEQLMSDAHDLYDLYEDTWNNYLDAIDEVKSQWNDILKGFDRVTNTLKHYEKITNLLYGGDQIEAGRAYLDQIYSATSASSLARQDVLRKEIDALQKEYDQILASGVAETDKDLVELKEAIQDAESSLESEIENYLDVIQNQLTNSIKSIMNTADKLMTNDRGINPVIERWNDSRDAAEGYYDEVERVYELERMESLWEDAISKTSTLKNQQYLTNIMNEQLKNLREKTKLSEYDIGLAEKELQIYQAQMALEDARANKNAMKLVRNEQGNWAYQYVADEDDIASKEENLLNSLYEKYEYVKNANIQATEDLLQLYQTAQERLTALLEEYKVADEARRAEITEEYEYLYNYYYGPEGLIIQKATETHAMEDDLNIAGMELLWDLYETDIENYDLMIESEKALIDALRDHDITTFRELIEAVATGDNSLYNQLLDKVTQVTDDSRTEWEELAHEIIANWATNPDSVKNIIVDAYNSIMLKVAEYDYAIALSEYKSGVAWSNITDHVLLAQWAVDSVYDSVWNVINQTDGLNDFRNRVNAIGDAWNLVAQNIANATSQMTGFLQLLGVSAQVNIPDYQKLLNPIASTKTFTADPNGSNGNNPSSLDDNKQQYRLVGHDNYGHETAWLLTGSSREDVLNQMAQQFANDRGEMGNYYQSYLLNPDPEVNAGGWTIVPIEESRAWLTTNGNSINNYSSSGMEGVRTGSYASNASLLTQMYDRMRLEAASMGVDVSSYYSNMPIVSPYEDPSSALYGSTLINNRNNNDNANSTTYNYNFESVNVQADDMDTFLKSIDYYCGKHEI